MQLQAVQVASELRLAVSRAQALVRCPVSARVSPEWRLAFQVPGQVELQSRLVARAWLLADLRVPMWLVALSAQVELERRLPPGSPPELLETAARPSNEENHNNSFEYLRRPVDQPRLTAFALR